MSVSIQQHSLSELKPSRWDNLSRQSIFKFMSNFQHGKLILQDDEGLHEFGDMAEKNLVARVTIHTNATYRRFLTGGSIGIAEAYMLGSWTSPNLVKVVEVFCANLQLLNNINAEKSILGTLSSRVIHWMNNNSVKGSKKNISAHYDLGNDFFQLFLDPTMMYSAAVYPRPEASLAEASVHKVDMICQKLKLNPEDHLIEIGTGWGAMAIHAAKHYGCQVTTTTISQEQHDYAKARIAEEGLEDKITLLCEDYRKLEGSYDKLVSVEMIEAVGFEHYDTYFAKCSSLLKEDGLMLIQAITIPDQRYEEAKNSVDFIKRYIFPGGCLPSNEAIANCVRRKTDMQIIGLEDITADYAHTLKDWREAFMDKIAIVRNQGFDDNFIRMWDYYLCYCEGGFRQRVISTAQIVFAKPRRLSL